VIFEFLGVSKFVERDAALGDAAAVAAVAIFVEDGLNLLGEKIHRRLSAAGENRARRQRDERSVAGEN
jgi:hypothetical protein